MPLPCEVCGDYEAVVCRTCTAVLCPECQRTSGHEGLDDEDDPTELCCPDGGA